MQSLLRNGVCPDASRNQHGAYREERFPLQRLEEEECPLRQEVVHGHEAIQDHLAAHICAQYPKAGGCYKRFDFQDEDSNGEDPGGPGGPAMFSIDTDEESTQSLMHKLVLCKECPCCYKVFTRTENVRSHLIQTSLRNGRCPKAKTKDDDRSGKRELLDKPHRCAICHKVVTGHRKIQDHMKQHFEELCLSKGGKARGSSCTGECDPVSEHDLLSQGARVYSQGSFATHGGHRYRRRHGEPSQAPVSREGGGGFSSDGGRAGTRGEGRGRV